MNTKQYKDIDHRAPTKYTVHGGDTQARGSHNSGTCDDYRTSILSSTPETVSLAPSYPVHKFPDVNKY